MVEVKTSGHVASYLLLSLALKFYPLGRRLARVATLFQAVSSKCEVAVNLIPERMKGRPPSKPTSKLL